MMTTFDTAFKDSAGAFLTSALQAIDPKLHEPLQGFTWDRDFPIRSDFDIGNDFTSYLISSYAATGGINPAGKSFVSKRSTTVPSVATDLALQNNMLYPWAQKTSFALWELQNAMKLGQSLDMMQVNVLRKKYNQDADIMSYLGDTDVGAFGLANFPTVTATPVAAGVTTGATLWSGKNYNEVLTDINTILMNAYYASGNTIYPTKLLVSPQGMATLAGQLTGTSGYQTTLKFVAENNVSTFNNGKLLEIVPVKWLTGTVNGNPNGVRASDTMIAYTPDYDYIRFPIIPLTSTPVQPVGLFLETNYLCKMGALEVVRPETIYIEYGY